MMRQPRADSGCSADDNVLVRMYNNLKRTPLIDSKGGRALARDSRALFSRLTLTPDDAEATALGHQYWLDRRSREALYTSHLAYSARLAPVGRVSTLGFYIPASWHG